MIKTVNIDYFSGTGSTAYIAEIFERTFEEAGIQVTRTRISQEAKVPEQADLELILFPVYAFNAPKPVDEWLERMPDVHKKRAAVISVSAGGEISPNTACRTRTINKLTSKGYLVRYETMFVMPCNFAISYHHSINHMLINIVPGRVRRATAQLLSGVVRRTRPFPQDYLFSMVGTLEKRLGGICFGGQLKADDTCTGCSWCAKNCPTGNIRMRGKKPEFSNKCVICLHCVYGCPQKAIRPIFLKFLVFKSGYDFSKMVERAKNYNKNSILGKYCKGYVMSGVRRYIKEENKQIW